jgi:hypothetical protein
LKLNTLKSKHALNGHLYYYDSLTSFIEAHSSKIDFITHEWIVSVFDFDKAKKQLLNKINEVDYLQKWILNCFPEFDISLNFEAENAELIEIDDFFLVYEMIDNSYIVAIWVIINLKFKVESLEKRGVKDSNSIHKDKCLEFLINLEIKEKNIVDFEIGDISEPI